MRLFLVVFFMNYTQAFAEVTQSVYKWFGLKVYEITLDSSDRTQPYQKKFVLTLNYKMNFSKEDIIEQSIKEVSPNLSVSDIEEFKRSLNGQFVDVKNGDSLSAHFIPNVGAEIYHNNTTKVGEIKDPINAKRFLDIWLGPNTSEPMLRDELLKR